MWKFLIEKFRFSALLIFAIVVTGVFSLATLPIESTPEVKIPYASIVTAYPGASPYDVEELITDVLEERIDGVEDIKAMDSSSVEGVSMIFIEFETDADIKEGVRNLQDAVSAVEASLPDDAEDPIVSELNYSNSPILVVSLSADLAHTELVEIAEDAQSEVLSVSGVSDVDLVGVRENEIVVEIDPEQLTKYSVSIFEVMNVLQSADINMPLGTVESNDIEYTLRFEAELLPEEIGNLVVRSGDVPIYLRDVAQVTNELSEVTRYSRISLEGSSPDDAISMMIYKKTGGDIVAIVDEIFEKLNAIEVADVQILATVDYAEDIRDQIGDLSWSGLQTIILVSITLFFSLGIREAIVAGLGIPLTFLIAFTAISLTGGTLNFLSLFSLILALGILVDTGVVITEGMHTKLQEGKTSKQIALETVREYQLPLISGTLTTVAAFVPMLLMTGIIGEFVKHIPRTVIYTLLASLFVGLGILPVIGSKILKVNKRKRKTLLERSISNVRKSYRSALDWFISKKQRQNLLIVSMLLLFFGSMALPITGALEATMFPEEDYRYFFIEVSLPDGSGLEETNGIAEQIEGVLLETPEVESFVTTVGSSSDSADGGLVGAIGTSSNLANFTVNLYEERERTSIEITTEYRKIFAEIPNADITVLELSSGPPGAAEIDFNIVGPDLDQLQDYSNEAISLLDSIDGPINLSSSLDDTVNEFVFTIDRQKAAEADLDAATLASVARISIAGMTVTTVKSDDEDLNVVLQTSSDTEIADVLSLPVLTSAGSFPLSHFVDVSFEPAPTVIVHSEGDRVVNITGDVKSGYVLANILSEFQEEFSIADADYSVEYGGELEEMYESFASLGNSMIIGVLLIIVILVLQFNSYLQCGIIIFAIPLALIGVFPGLTLAGLPFSFPAFVGVVALAGIVVNNAIILIDRINNNIRKRGMTKKEAILEAGPARFQPIILTSITTIFGIIPLALSDPTWGPLGFTIIFGLAFSTVLTLVVVPSMYMRFVKRVK